MVDPVVGADMDGATVTGIRLGSGIDVGVLVELSDGSSDDVSGGFSVEEGGAEVV